MARCFLAISIDDDIKTRISEVQERIKEPALKLVGRENLHITLKFLGEISDREIEDICSKLEGIRMPVFGFEVAGLGVFPSANYIRVLWVGVRDSGRLAELSGKIDAALSGYRTDAFSPHITIARARYKPSRLTEVILGNNELSMGCQMAESFTIKKSTLTQKGPVYEDIKTFQLVA